MVGHLAVGVEGDLALEVGSGRPDLLCDGPELLQAVLAVQVEAKGIEPSGYVQVKLRCGGLHYWTFPCLGSRATRQRPFEASRSMP